MAKGRGDCHCCRPQTGHILKRIEERQWREVERAAAELVAAQREAGLPADLTNVIPLHRYRQLPDGWWSV